MKGRTEANFMGDSCYCFVGYYWEFEGYLMDTRCAWHC